MVDNTYVVYTFSLREFYIFILMLRLAVFMVFVISAAMAAGGIILSSRLRSRHHDELFPALVYFQVFIFTFGFYGIWGHVILREFISPYITGENLDRLSDFHLLLGLPFLVLAMLMFIRASCFISARKCSNLMLYIYLALNITAIAVLGYIISGDHRLKPALLLKMYFIVLNSVSALICLFMVFFSDRKGAPLTYYDRKIAGVSLAAILIAQCIPLFFNEPVTGLLFILLFFTGSAFLPVYLTYGATIQFHAEETVRSISFEEFCRKHEISPRESDIIREICNGMSNKEISERLFISVQTVKDHTHRIYIKTNVRSRAQLMNLVSEAGSKSVER